MRSKKAARLEVGLRRVEVGEQAGVPVEQLALAIVGSKLGRANGSPLGVAAEPALALEAAPELRAGERDEQAHHRQRDRRVAMKLALRVEDMRAVGVEADDEAGHHLEAGAR